MCKLGHAEDGVVAGSDGDQPVVYLDRLCLGAGPGDHANPGRHAHDPYNAVVKDSRDDSRLWWPKEVVSVGKQDQASHDEIQPYDDV